MTKVAFQSNARDFLERCGKILEKDPIEHNLILSLCQAAERRRVNGEDSNIKCAIVTDDDGEFVVGAVQAPPHNLVLSKAQSLDIDQLAETLLKHKFTFPGIVGPSDVTGTFAEKWTALTSLHTEESMDQIIYMLKGRELLMPTVEGEMRFAGKADVKQITEWIGAFSKSALPRAEQINTKDAKAQAEELAESGRLAFWTVKGKPVAQASFSGTDRVVRINRVYTPPENRGHGYASAVVANLTKLQLDQGKTMSCLYADARNTQANSIYRKIGYEFAGRSTLYVLGKAS
jgi:predicted GNAT family acetyltransferase